MKHQELNLDKALGRMARYAAEYNKQWHTAARDEKTERILKLGEHRNLFERERNKFKATPKCVRKYRKAEDVVKLIGNE